LAKEAIGIPHYFYYNATYVIPVGEDQYMYIFAGKLKGRRIDAPRGKDIRPTSGRTREAIFNILSHGQFLKDDHTFLEDCRVLDLYCGSGALAFEAISRGATHAVLIDIEASHLEAARYNAARMGIEKQLTCLRSDSSNPPPARISCNLVFIDPPYLSGLAQKTLANIANSGWLADEAVIVVELNKKEDLILPPNFEELTIRRYGITKVIVLRWKKS
jgi:16S rRNA (guanine966-N2)-methyltransferase